MNRIGVISAMSSELIPLKNIVESTYVNAGYMFRISGIGRSCAVTNTIDLITRCKCNAIFNFGSCGSYGSKYKIGDVLVPDIILDGDISYPKENVWRDPVHIYDCKESELKNIETSNDHICLYTRSSFSNKKEYDTNNYIEDMEAYEILNVCNYFHIPCHICKIVINEINENSIEQFNNNLIEICNKNINKVFNELEYFTRRISK